MKQYLLFPVGETTDREPPHKIFETAACIGRSRTTGAARSVKVSRAVAACPRDRYGGTVGNVTDIARRKVVATEAPA
jgi:hypothetical protein